MATHDYVIANGTGAAVRSDLNNALAAIVSNNSGSSEPATTYAYQWWADTNANVLKLRNSANNAWITLRELDGTMLIEDGSAASPGLAFADDTDTGLFSSAANKVNFATAGVERLEIGDNEVVFNDPGNDVNFRVESDGNASMLFVDAGNDRIGVGTSSPAHAVHIAGATTPELIVEDTTNNVKAVVGADNTVGRIGTDTNHDLTLRINDTEQARIDTSGRLIVGTSSSLNVGSSAAAMLQVEHGSGSVTGAFYCTANTAQGGTLVLGSNRGSATTAVQDDDTLGDIRFAGSDGTDMATQGARIAANVDGTPGSDDMPTRLTFLTCSDGASSPTERMRLDSGGLLLVGLTSSQGSGTLQVKETIAACRASNSTSSGQNIGTISFSDARPGTYAHIKCQSDNTPGSGDYPGSLQFATTADGASSPSERMRIQNNGNILMSKTSGSITTPGHEFFSYGSTYITTNTQIPLYLNRQSTDGTLVSLRHANAEEGRIAVSGSTVSYVGAHLSRWSQLAGGAERTEILRGSVLSNLDEMCEWAHAAQDAVLYAEEDELPEGVSVGDVKTPAVDAYTEDNEQLNRMKVSDVEGDVNVAGVFQAWDDDDDTFTNDFYCAMTGDFIIRIAQGTTVARGDLLMSAGDGTAKPQDDDIVRSKTIAKVTSTTVSTTYSDGSYCVPCVLMAC